MSWCINVFGLSNKSLYDTLFPTNWVYPLFRHACDSLNQNLSLTLRMDGVLQDILVFRDFWSGSTLYFSRWKLRIHIQDNIRISLICVCVSVSVCLCVCVAVFLCVCNILLSSCINFFALSNTFLYYKLFHTHWVYLLLRHAEDSLNQNLSLTLWK
jgi:hypothetical protein